MNDLSTNIKVERTRKRLTQAELAEKIGVHVCTISAIETGKQQPLFKTVRKISEALQVPIETFAE